MARLWRESGIQKSRYGGTGMTVQGQLWDC